MAKIRFKRSSQATSHPDGKQEILPNPIESLQAIETIEQQQQSRAPKTTTSTLNLNVVQSKTQNHSQPQQTPPPSPPLSASAMPQKPANSDKSTSKRSRTSLSAFKFLPSFYYQSSSSASSSSSSSSNSPSSTSIADAGVSSATSTNNKQQQSTFTATTTTTTNNSSNLNNKSMNTSSSVGNPLRSKSKRFSLMTASLTANANNSGKSKSINHDPLQMTVDVIATTAAQASTHTPNVASSKVNITTNSSNNTVISTSLPPYEIEVTDIDGSPYIECPLCVLLVAYDTTPDLRTCGHRTCSECMQLYLKTEINHSRLNITCPICSEPLMQSVIRQILNDDKFYFKYESFMLRKVLAAEPDARWCPAPDCGYAVLANGCASCPRLLCERDGCNTAFCYHCKQEWHPNQTCSAASAQRNKRAGMILNALNISDLIEESTQSNGSHGGGHTNGRGGNGIRKSSKTSQQQNNATLRPEDIKECPKCSSRIIKMNDGSCNHMTCSICETEFCWLCMKEISDFHYFSPSGCTFWGKKPWSRKKKFLWRLGMLVGAPICIVFIAGISVPAIVIGIPFWAARKLHARLEKKQFGRYRKSAIVTGGVLLSLLVSPIITAMALAVGIPLLLGYVYGVVPLSLCRSSGSCLSATPSVENLHEQFTQAAAVARRLNNRATDVVSIDTATSHKLGNPSIGETSMYLSNISLETNSIGGPVISAERDDRESASNAALAGSIFSQNIDDGNSIRALAGSIISKDSGGYIFIPVEVHNHSADNQQQLSSSSSFSKSSGSNNQ